MRTKALLLIGVLLVVMVGVSACKDKTYGAYKTILITEQSYQDLARGVITLYKDGQINEEQYNQLKAMGKKVEFSINTAKTALRLYISFNDDQHRDELARAVADMATRFSEFQALFNKGGV